ncbi:MAG TPA: hypothetical protein VJB66_01880 [Candidatus Nanoarchaeia archaeon]|nr:hypothetical protein [Candidatus Nanoarchaeia archaeon]
MGVFKTAQELEQKDWINEEDFYEEDARILLLEDDELTPAEDGFMKGYDEKLEEEL